MKIKRGHLLLFSWTPLASAFLSSQPSSQHQQRHSGKRWIPSYIGNQNNALLMSSQGDMDQLAREWASRNRDDSSPASHIDTANTMPEEIDSFDNSREVEYDPAVPPGGQTLESSSTTEQTGYSKVRDWVMGDPEKKSYSFTGKTYGASSHSETMPSSLEPVNGASDQVNNDAPGPTTTSMADLAVQWAARNAESQGQIEAPSMMKQSIYEPANDSAQKANNVEIQNSDLESYPEPLPSEYSVAEETPTVSMADLAAEWASMSREEERDAPEDTAENSSDDSLQTITPEVVEDIVVAYEKPVAQPASGEADTTNEQNEVSDSTSLEGKTKEVIRKIAESEPKQFSDGTGAILLGFAASLLALIPIGLGSFSPPTKEMPETSVPIRSQPAAPSSLAPRSETSASSSAFRVPSPDSKYKEPISDNTEESLEGKAPSDIPRVIPKYSEETKRTEAQQLAPTDTGGPQTFEEVMSQRNEK